MLQGGTTVKVNSTSFLRNIYTVFEMTVGTVKTVTLELFLQPDVLVTSIDRLMQLKEQGQKHSK